MLILLTILSSILWAGQAEYDDYRYKVIKAEQEYLSRLNHLPPSTSGATFEKHRQDMVNQQSAPRAEYDAVLLKEMNSKIDSALAKNKASVSESGISSPSVGTKKTVKSDQNIPPKKPSISSSTQEEREVDGMIILKGGKIRQRNLDPSTGAGEIKVDGAKELSFGKENSESLPNQIEEVQLEKTEPTPDAVNEISFGKKSR